MIHLRRIFDYTGEKIASVPGSYVTKTCTYGNDLYEWEGLFKAFYRREYLQPLVKEKNSALLKAMLDVSSAMEKVYGDSVKKGRLGSIFRKRKSVLESAKITAPYKKENGPLPLTTSNDGRDVEAVILIPDMQKFKDHVESFKSAGRELNYILEILDGDNINVSLASEDLSIDLKLDYKEETVKQQESTKKVVVSESKDHEIKKEEREEKLLLLEYIKRYYVDIRATMVVPSQKTAGTTLNQVERFEDFVNELQTRGFGKC